MPIVRSPKPSDVLDLGRGVKRPKGPKPAYKMRVYKETQNVDREYLDMNQMQKWQQYYKEQGFRTRRI